MSILSSSLEVSESKFKLESSLAIWTYFGLPNDILEYVLGLPSLKELDLFDRGCAELYCYVGRPN